MFQSSVNYTAAVLMENHLAPLVCNRFLAPDYEVLESFCSGRYPPLVTAKHHVILSHQEAFIPSIDGNIRQNRSEEESERIRRIHAARS